MLHLTQQANADRTAAFRLCKQLGKAPILLAARSQSNLTEDHSDLPRSSIKMK
jgi:hypothetical protein